MEACGPGPSGGRLLDDRDVGPHRVSSMQVQVVTPLLHRADPIDDTIDWKEAMKALIYKLTVLHSRLEDEIRSEYKRRLPDAMRLLRLKKLRLAVKDRLHRTMTQAFTRSPMPKLRGV